MDVLHISAFADGEYGGNPAGVAICDALPDPAVMQRVAAEVGYSETAFAAPERGVWRVRYFAPESEVDFCGHATIALGAALAQHDAPGLFTLDLNHARITVEGQLTEAGWGASFQSPPTRSAPVDAGVLEEALKIFGLAGSDLDPRIPPAVAHGGGDHLVLALRDRSTLSGMEYDFDRARALAQREGFVTFDLVTAQTAQVFHSRNPFPLGGVHEDPATGAAAAALAGYLRDIDWPHGGRLTIHQGTDMGVPSVLNVEIPPERGSSIRVSGQVRTIREPQTHP